MKRRLLLLLTVLTLSGAFVGCSSSSGSREFVPGKGWVPN